MTLREKLAQYFSPKALTRRVAAIKTIRTPVLDTLFPNPVNRGVPYIAFDLAENTSTPIPGVVPGSQAYNMREGRAEKRVILEGINFRLKDTTSAEDLDYQQMNDFQGLDVTLDGMLTRMKNALKKSREVVATLALNGEINYAVWDEGNLLEYHVTFGDTLTYVPDTLWDAAENNEVAPFVDMKKMGEAIEEESGYVNTSVAYCASDVMDALILWAGKKGSGPFNDMIRIGELGRVMSFGGYNIYEVNTKYKDLLTNATKKTIPDGHICVVAKDAPFEEAYASISDLKAGLRGVPMFSKSWESEDPSGRTVLLHSKPLPLVYVPKAICWAEVLG